MDIQKLKGVLNIIDHINVERWEMVMLVVDEISKSNVEILSKSWNNDFKNKNEQYYPLDLSILDTWSTFERCVSFNFYIESDKLVSEAKIYNGDSFNGFRKEMRFQTKLLFKDEFLSNIESSIMYKFNGFLSDKYDNYLLDKKNKWIDNKKIDILKSL